MGKGRGGGTDGGGGSSGGGGSGRSAPAPRLSTFLRTFGTTSEARCGVDVDAEYVERRGILLNYFHSGVGSGSGGSSGSASRGGGGAGAHRGATSPLARLICGGASTQPPKEVREALERFLQAVVRVTGGDTLLPDQLAVGMAPFTNCKITVDGGSQDSPRDQSDTREWQPYLADASLLAFESVSHLVRQGLEKAAKWAEEEAYGRDADLAKKRGQADERDFLKRKKAALAAALGPVADAHVAEFDGVAKALVQLQEKLSAGGAGSGSGAGGGSGSQGGAAAAAVEFGADIVFVAPGSTKASSSQQQQQQQQQHTAGAAHASSAAKAAASMKAGLGAAAATETGRRAADAAAYGGAVQVKLS
jgi:hypothetical protein